MAKVRLNDGYDVKEDTGPVYGLDNILVHYRPPLAEAVAECQAKQARATGGKDYIEAMFDFFEGRLIGWDLQNEKDDQPIAVGRDVLKLVPYQILERVQTVVMGYARKAKDKADAKNSNPG